MNKQLFMSIAMLAFAGVAIAGATGAFFSDTETSTGNTFTAGAIDLTVDSEQHYNGNECKLEGSSYKWKGEAAYPVPETECTGSWELTDLDDDSVTGHKFFNFSDLKPGDYGENTISIHVETNDAYMCAALVNVGGEDLDSTKTEPEVTEGDTSFGSTAADSELDEELSFFAWVDEGVTPGFGDDEDSEGDNIYQDGETKLGSAKASELSNVVWSLTDIGNPITASTTAYIGVAWCYGEFDQDHNCSGLDVDNMSQTDSWFTDMAFYVEQSRNNDQFSCDNWTVLPQ
jgi:predicted ribosomally synthesized peptide with SipW-like signal peptide